jgi:hypothetical protein
MTKYEVIVITGAGYVVEADSADEALDMWSVQTPDYIHIDSVDINKCGGM